VYSLWRKIAPESRIRVNALERAADRSAAAASRSWSGRAVLMTLSVSAPLGREIAMQLYMDVHEQLPNGKPFCLVAAPSADAAIAVHREAHGLVPDRIYPVVEGL
jgi:hypothetical protein